MFKIPELSQFQDIHSQFCSSWFSSFSQLAEQKFKCVPACTDMNMSDKTHSFQVLFHHSIRFCNLRLTGDKAQSQHDLAWLPVLHET